MIGNVLELNHGSVVCKSGGGSGQSPRPPCLAPFLLKTYDLLEEGGVNGGEEDSKRIVSWNAEGNGFVVWSPAEFSDLTLP